MPISKILRICGLVSSLLMALPGVAAAQMWIELSPTGGPPSPRSSSPAVYDLSTKRMTIFGGFDNNGASNEVWVLENTNGQGGTPTWTQLNPTGGPPSPRGDSSAVYDPKNNRMTIFAGWSNPAVFRNDVWVLEYANGLGGTPTWTQLNPTGGPPSPRCCQSAVYDPNTNRMTIFGGSETDGTVLNDVWVLENANGLGGTPTWTRLRPTGGPSIPLMGSSAVYDPNNNNRMTIFGGWLNVDAATDDVWVLEYANGQGGTPHWTQLNPPGEQPSPRGDSSAVYDPKNNRMTIFAGQNVDFRNLNDVWVLENANGLGGTPTWTQLDTTGGPPSGRLDPSAVYDPSTNRMTIFGGAGRQ